jgi:hypothetical protein
MLPFITVFSLSEYAFPSPQHQHSLKRCKCRACVVCVEYVVCVVQPISANRIYEKTFRFNGVWQGPAPVYGVNQEGRLL